VETVLTVLHAGGKFGGGGYKVSGGLHGVGSSVVNALSEWLEVEVKQNGHVYFMRFHQGEPEADLQVVGDTDETGTTISFKPDPEIFTETTEFDYEVLQKRLRELAFLNKGLRIVLHDERPDQERTEEFYYEGGIVQFVEYLNRNREPLHDEVIYCEGEKDGLLVEVALQYNDSYVSNIYSFANNIHTHEGGTHEAGFKTALTRVINDTCGKGLRPSSRSSCRNRSLRDRRKRSWAIRRRGV